MIELKVGTQVYHPVHGIVIVTKIIPGVAVKWRPLYWHEKLLRRVLHLRIQWLRRR